MRHHKIFIARCLMAGASLALAAGAMAQSGSPHPTLARVLMGGGVNPGDFVPVAGCKGTSCEIDVQVWLKPRSLPVARRDECVVQVPKIWVVGTGVNLVKWIIKQQNPTEEVTFEFRNEGAGATPPFGIRILDTADYLAGGVAIWERKNLTVNTEVEFGIKGRPVSGKRPTKASAYEVYVRYQIKGGQWIDCDTHDPIIVNAGD